MAAYLQLHVLLIEPSRAIHFHVHLKCDQTYSSLAAYGSHYANCPLTTPDTYRAVCASQKKPAGFSSISFTVNPAPVSVPFDRTPIVNGLVRHPTERWNVVVADWVRESEARWSRCVTNGFVDVGSSLGRRLVGSSHALECDILEKLVSKGR